MWIRDTRTAQRRLLLRLGGTAHAQWAPDGSAFYVADRLASGRRGQKQLNVREILWKADRQISTFATGHVYVEGGATAGSAATAKSGESESASAR